VLCPQRRSGLRRDGQRGLIRSRKVYERARGQWQHRLVMSFSCCLVLCSDDRRKGETVSRSLRSRWSVGWVGRTTTQKRAPPERLVDDLIAAARATLPLQTTTTDNHARDTSTLLRKTTARYYLSNTYRLLTAPSSLSPRPDSFYCCSAVTRERERCVKSLGQREQPDSGT